MRFVGALRPDSFLVRWADDTSSMFHDSGVVIQHVELRVFGRSSFVATAEMLAGASNIQPPSTHSGVCLGHFRQAVLAPRLQ